MTPLRNTDIFNILILNTFRFWCESKTIFLTVFCWYLLIRSESVNPHTLGFYCRFQQNFVYFPIFYSFSQTTKILIIFMIPTGWKNSSSIFCLLSKKTELKNINCITVSFGERVEHPFSEIHQYLGQQLRLLLKDPPFLIWKKINTKILIQVNQEKVSSQILKIWKIGLIFTYFYFTSYLKC